MVNEILVCGDSFGCGSGLPEETAFENSFGGKVAEHFDVPLKVYARGGCCNYVIYLQVKKIVEQYKNSLIKPFVLITTTHHSRFTFPSDSNTEHSNYSISDVDYLNYHPYSKTTPETCRKLPPFELNKNPKLVSETVSNIVYYLKGEVPNLKYLFTRIARKLNSVKMYYADLYDDEIKHSYDDGIILLAHNELKAAGIDHLIMTPERERHKFIDKENFFFNDWGYYSRKYPDNVGSGHCNEIGHMEVAKLLIERIKGK